MPITLIFQTRTWEFAWTATLSDATQVYPRGYDAALVLDLTRTEAATFTHGAPTILQTLFAAATAESTVLVGLKTLIGGSELPTALSRRTPELGATIYAGHGCRRAPR